MMAAQALTNKITKTTHNFNDYNQNINQRTYRNEFKQNRPTKFMLARRHTIQSMTSTTATPLTSQKQNNFDIHYAKHINLDNQLLTPMTTPFGTDSKAYVGSFNKVTQSPLPRALHQPNQTCNFNYFDSQDNNNNNNNNNSGSQNEVIEFNKFNNDFYRLCSGNETFFDNETTSDIINLNLSSAQHIVKEKSSLSNLTNHVNAMFDQWLNTNVVVGVIILSIRCLCICVQQLGGQTLWQ